MKHAPDTSFIDEWLVETEGGPPDSVEGTRQVMARLPQTPQAGRWLPFPMLHRKAQTPTPTDTSEYKATSIPATNGQSPTVTRSTNSMFSPTKAITAGALVFALGGVLLIAQPFDQQGGAVPGAATDGVGLEPASVTGEMKTLSYFLHDGGGLEGEIADGVWHEEGPWSGRFEMDDSRLTGDATGYDSGNRYQMDENHSGLAEVGGGTITIENDGGAWEGSTLGVSGTARSDMHRDTMVAELTGTGGYDGLSALLFVEQVEPGSPDNDVYGAIVPGELLPEVPAGALSATE